ncbi:MULTISPECIES: WcbI family polysaccharide biosynthesis putative acetyltransferase [Mycobacteriaceae]|uniref:WcbI family polysaccharide biosynthesis putative acetyltransferase n=1 Tax=Mycobacteriaceae TaxID=1762 RepID=UPI001E3615E9|nr:MULTISPECIES: WcbI family polysaccharide biosynthesis putative acetyltransferase [Mycobacteriaceae]MCK0177055.1 WcbI family polysaccharide biosynthesis putative acetyltransferase [Mycolicibacterium sp. F2034L]
MNDADAGRVWHYRDFYRPPGTPPPTSEPLWLVVGNCQAEALRLILDAVPQRPYRTARIPPVHELQQSDLRHLDDLLRETAVLIAQPIRDDYRDLPIGTAQLAGRLPRGSKVVRWPVIRYAGLYPFQAIVRNPADRSITPDPLPYHDLRTIVAARDGRPADAAWDVEVSAAQLRAVAEASREELARRERAQTDVGVSDVLTAHGADAAHTINHPGNGVLADLARRVMRHENVTLSVTPPARALLGSIIAPLEARVLAALGIDTPPRPNWQAPQRSWTPDEVHTAALRWYRDHPEFVPLAFERHARTLDLLGLTAGVAG